jgi:hypothetical protein
VFGQGSELASKGRLAVLAGSKAALGLAAALLGLMELAATRRTNRLRPALDPEALATALAALGAIAADIEDVLPRPCGSSPSDVALQGVASFADRTRSLWSRRLARRERPTKARDMGVGRTTLVSKVTSSETSA